MSLGASAAASAAPPNDPPRVSFVIKTIVGRAGGAEKVLCNAANTLADAGARVTIYHGDEPGRPFFELRSSVDVISVRPKDRPIRQTAAASTPGGVAARHRFPRSLLTWWRDHGWWVIALRRFLRAARPDVAIAFQPSSTTDTLLAAVGTGIPVVASLHNVPEQDFTRAERWDPNPFDRYLRKRSLRLAARITVLLEEFRAWFPRGLQDRIVVLPNAVHVSGPLADPARDDAVRNTIIVVGRLAPAKDHACLIDAWATMHGRHPTWQVEIYGGGPLRKTLQSRIAERGVGGSLFLRGESDAVMDHYARAKIFCIPSLFEGFGLVTAEALGKGLPAVGFADCPGTNSLIRHEHNGLLADPAAHGGDRTAALAAVLQRLMTDAEMRGRFGAAGPASVADYRPAAVAQRWIDLVNDTLPSDRRFRQAAPAGAAAVPQEGPLGRPVSP